MYKADEVGGSPVISGREATEVLELAKASFDAVSVPVDFEIVWDADLAAAIRRGRRLGDDAGDQGT